MLEGDEAFGVPHGDRSEMLKRPLFAALGLHVVNIQCDIWRLLVRMKIKAALAVAPFPLYNDVRQQVSSVWVGAGMWHVVVTCLFFILCLLRHYHYQHYWFYGFGSGADIHASSARVL